VIGRIRELLKAAPFTPFFVHTNGGRTYKVKTAVHAQVSPRASQVNIWSDDGGGVTLADVHISAVETAPVPEA
jgi:hypothetical protein